MRLNQIELNIIRSFGWALVELESTLFERYRVSSPNRSLTTLEEFRKQLREMESKGYVSSLKLHGKRAYRKLIVNGPDSATLPRNPLDEMHLVIGSLKAKSKENEANTHEV
ncbi:MAG: hypothetical protein GF309_08300 [Candidatus Lokiarchaeota archaeon]|nr:hypothetical protein [Candidatus Lokiarchaeota archaeon]